ncbi:hypothetical protein [Sandarakinorhabdus sp. DWP1-3-1]|uniref:hypothetical protein n=1 Tax=Sandarakinorhabdus sp. DWP1-3-1 TaxID=2804627 RepID=UPI003CF7CD5D
MERKLWFDAVVGLGGIAGITSVLGGVFWLGKLDTRLDVLEKAIKQSAAESRTLDPIRLRCAALAQQAATFDTTPTARTPNEIKDVMTNLGCREIAAK